MKNKIKSRINFVVDQKLIQEERTEFLIRALQDEKIKYHTELREVDEFNLSVIFSHKKSIKNFSQYKNRLIVVDLTDDL
ncbi:MAG: hypothetical protein ACXVCE_07380, partial [Bacteriovorax sp.]